MPMPHRVQMQLIRRRLTGKEGAQRIGELRAILRDLPNYRNGPYADVRKWVEAEIDATRVRKRTVHRDSISIRREGAAQVALVGAPNGGKSSLLQALSDLQIKIGDYAFTTLRPVPALTRIHGILVQLVEIPGLIEGAAEDRGGGRALLGVLRGADAILYCHDVTAPPHTLHQVRAEVAAAGIRLPAVLVATKADEADPDAVAALAATAPELAAHPVSILDDGSLDALRDVIWDLVGLMRVDVVTGDDEDPPRPLALPTGATVADVARAVHGRRAERTVAARVWGSSARFHGQRVGLAHVLEEGDRIALSDIR
jgi:uncharacterized protein